MAELKDILTFKIEYVAKKSKETYFKYFRVILPPASFVPQVKFNGNDQFGNETRLNRSMDVVGTVLATSFNIFLHEKNFMVSQTEISHEAERKIWNGIKALHEGAGAAERLITTVMASVRNNRIKLNLFCTLNLQVVKKQCPVTHIEYWEWKDHYRESDITNMQLQRIDDIVNCLGSAEPLKAKDKPQIGVQEMTVGVNKTSKVISETLKERKAALEVEIKERAAKSRQRKEDKERGVLVDTIARENGIQTTTGYVPPENPQITEGRDSKADFFFM